VEHSITQSSHYLEVNSFPFGSFLYNFTLNNSNLICQSVIRQNIEFVLNQISSNFVRIIKCLKFTAAKKVTQLTKFEIWPHQLYHQIQKNFSVHLTVINKLRLQGHTIHRLLTCFSKFYLSVWVITRTGSSPMQSIFNN